MEACLVNLLEPGDSAGIGVAGVFGTRMAEIVRRCGARAVCVEVEMGQPVPSDRMVEAIDNGARLICVHPLTSDMVFRGAYAMADPFFRACKRCGF